VTEKVKSKETPNFSVKWKQVKYTNKFPEEISQKTRPKIDRFSWIKIAGI
tara:strand:- start:5325 stop:5474 length:150 start_codon:yes stop_codon:yes gene_type:complete